MLPTWMHQKISTRNMARHPVDTIGVEIEVEGRNLPRAIFQNWVLHDDGSLRGDDNAEYVLREPLKRKDVDLALKYLEEKFQESNARVDNESDRTSVHIHLNVQDRTWCEIFTIWTLWTIVEDLSFELCGNERRGNLFCLRFKDCEGLLRIISTQIDEGGFPFNFNDHRYACLNLMSVGKFGSLEWRGMHGTVDRKEILNWIDFLLCVLKAASAFDNPQQVISRFSQVGPERFLEEVLQLERSQIGALKSHPEYRQLLWEGMRLSQDIAWMFSDWGKKPEKKQREKTEKEDILGDNVVLDQAQWEPENFAGINEDGGRARVDNAAPMPRWLLQEIHGERPDQDVRNMQREHNERMQQAMRPNRRINPPAVLPGDDMNPPQPEEVRPPDVRVANRPPRRRRRLVLPQWNPE